MFAEKQFLDMVRSTIMAFPDGRVGIADSWEGKVMSPHSFLPEIDATYTLKESDKGVVGIDVGSTITLDKIPAPAQKSSASQTRVKMNGFYRGTLHIDKASGLMIRKKTKMQLSGQVIQGQTIIPMAIESVVTVEPV